MTPIQSFFITAFLNFAGPITLLAFLLWLNSLWSVVGPFPAMIRGQGRIWALALLGATAIFLSTRIDFKVLSDETNLLSVGNMLAVFGRASNTEMWQYYYHNYHALDVAVPSRPVLFPVLVAIVHYILGMHWWSPFVVNFLSLVVLLGLVLQWAAARIPAAFLPLSLTLLALLMSPILSIVATSAGYDLVSLTVGFACFLLLFAYEREPTPARLECLFFGLICFASVRYESIVALPFTAVGLYLWEGRGLFRKITFQTVLIAAVMIFPLLVQRVLTWGSFENPPGVAPFSLEHAANHLPVFLHSFFLDASGPYPILLHWMGLGGLVVAVRRLSGLATIPLVFSAFVLLLLLSHHFGFANHPTQARLFLPISFSLGLLALYFVKSLDGHLDGRHLLIGFAVLCFHHRGYALHDPLTAQLTMTREVRHLRDFLRDNSTREDLWVYDRPGQLTALGLSAISWTKFDQDMTNVLANVRAGLYQKLFLIERVPFHLKNPGDFPLERSGFRLAPQLIQELSGEEFLRVSRVELSNPNPIDPPKAPAVPNAR